MSLVKVHVITGGAGFIGSALLWKLNTLGIDDVAIVDHLGTDEKWRNLSRLRFCDYVDRDNLMEWLEGRPASIERVIHLGACADTTERDASFLMENNFVFSKRIWEWCALHEVPLVYASSAAIYGSGAAGQSDRHDVNRHTPLNAYAFSKLAFDRWVEKQVDAPPAWAGLRFFNVYGPNEYHKDRMASVVLHAFQNLQDGSSSRLFRSYRPEYKHGHQCRDFVYIKDVIDVIVFALNQSKSVGILNVGTGKARSFNDLARAVAAAMNTACRIEYIDMPERLRATYQYFTQADITKLRALGYTQAFTALEDGIAEYVQNYLLPGGLTLGG